MEKKELHFVQTHGGELPAAAHSSPGSSRSPWLPRGRRAVYSWNAQTRRVCHLPRFHESSSSGITGGRSLTPWNSTPADENRNGNVGSGRIASLRAVASRCVAASSGRSRTASLFLSLSLSLSLLLSLSPIPGRRYSANTIPVRVTPLTRGYPLRCHEARRWKRTDRRPAWVTRHEKEKPSRGKTARALRAQARVMPVATGESPRRTKGRGRSKKKNFASRCLHILSLFFFTPSSRSRLMSRRDTSNERADGSHRG